MVTTCRVITSFAFMVDFRLVRNRVRRLEDFVGIRKAGRPCGAAPSAQPSSRATIIQGPSNDELIENKDMHVDGVK
jgi:hypothetical protein